MFAILLVFPFALHCGIIKKPKNDYCWKMVPEFPDGYEECWDRKWDPGNTELDLTCTAFWNTSAYYVDESFSQYNWNDTAKYTKDCKEGVGHNLCCAEYHEEVTYIPNTSDQSKNVKRKRVACEISPICAWFIPNLPWFIPLVAVLFLALIFFLFVWPLICYGKKKKKKAHKHKKKGDPSLASLEAVESQPQVPEAAPITPVPPVVLSPTPPTPKTISPVLQPQNEIEPEEVDKKEIAPVEKEEKVELSQPLTPPMSAPPTATPPPPTPVAAIILPTTPPPTTPPHATPPPTTPPFAAPLAATPPPATPPITPPFKTPSPPVEAEDDFEEVVAAAPPVSPPHYTPPPKTPSPQVDVVVIDDFEEVVAAPFLPDEVHEDTPPPPPPPLLGWMPSTEAETLSPTPVVEEVPEEPEWETATERSVPIPGIDIDRSVVSDTDTETGTGTGTGSVSSESEGEPGLKVGMRHVLIMGMLAYFIH